MRIGILTFWWAYDNYGQLLQCYALQRFLEKRGHEPFLIRYEYKTEIQNPPVYHKFLKLFNVKKLVSYLRTLNMKRKIQNEMSFHNRHFDDFRKKYIKFGNKLYLSYKELVENPPEADCYIVGSDQVWNPDCIGGINNSSFENILNAYFLNFGSAKKMSYSASWGRDSIDVRTTALVHDLLKKFDYVSVREKSGIKICENCGYNAAEWVCDPTLLLSADDYRDLYLASIKDIRKKNKKYILVNLLTPEFQVDMNKIYEFARSNAFEVVYISGNSRIDKYEKFYATIPEWLYLLDNAEYVITNSYHCSIFSILFHKKFGVFPLTGDKAKMNTRFESLFDVFGIKERFIMEYDFSILDTDYVSNDIKVSETFLNELERIG